MYSTQKKNGKQKQQTNKIQSKGKKIKKSREKKNFYC